MPRAIGFSQDLGQKYYIPRDTLRLASSGTACWVFQNYYLECQQQQQPPPPKHLHPKQPEFALLPPNSTACRRHRSSQAQSQHPPRMCWRHDTIIPQPSRREHRVAFPFDTALQFWIHGFAYGFHYGRELLRAHDADFGVGPHPEETW